MLVSVLSSLTVSYFNSSILRGDVGHNMLPGCGGLAACKAPENI